MKTKSKESKIKILFLITGSIAAVRIPLLVSQLVKKNYEIKCVISENAEKINRRINAYNPSPCAWFSLNNKRIKILKAEVIHDKGEAVKIMNEEFLIGCGINSIRPLLLRVEGKQDCSINDFLLGHKIEVGSYI